MEEHDETTETLNIISQETNEALELLKEFPADGGYGLVEIPNNWLPGDHLLTFVKKEIPSLVTKYVGMIELERTNKICRCEWIIHPDDVNAPEGKRRLRRGQTVDDCPVHTKEGFLLYFFEWVFTRRVPGFETPDVS